VLFVARLHVLASVSRLASISTCNDQQALGSRGVQFLKLGLTVLGSCLGSKHTCFFITMFSIAQGLLKITSS
jgi:hypothetical protein